MLWTPGYWGWNEGLYVWHGGYWGLHVGFYGGVNYGFGYVGTGYAGGYWSGRNFFYNRTVNNVNVTNVHIYNKTVINNNITVNKVSYNGGPGGINTRPSPAEQRFAAERRFEPTARQVEHARAAGNNRELLASVNHGRPAIAATARAADFHGHSVAAARPQPPAARAAENRPMRADVPRPVGSTRNGDRARPAGPQGQARADARPRFAERPAPQTYPSSYHPETARPRESYHAEAPRPRESSAPRAQQEKGREPRAR
jgi:hypothetical protein